MVRACVVEQTEEDRRAGAGRRGAPHQRGERFGGSEAARRAHGRPPNSGRRTVAARYSSRRVPLPPPPPPLSTTAMQAPVAGDSVEHVHHGAGTHEMYLQYGQSALALTL